MKKLFIAVLLLSSFLSTSAWAESHILGTWQGELNYQDSDGYTTTCTTENTFSMEAEQLTFKQLLSANCDWENTLTMQVQGEEIWFGGEKVGQLTGDNSIEVKDVMIDEGIMYSFALTTDDAEGVHAVFSDQTIYIHDDYADGLNGEMTKVVLKPLP